ncbi:MAG TPA: lipopolysaccharide biosynthesis protein [Treponemataceae bacterium]|nr:lipopolysaccharide biosynthesis protein [Treponemataceae bacterium]HQC27550.1 lipopolysaccharide biosynthesis protein [Treponemataceae bacterium]
MLEKPITKRLVLTSLFWKFMERAGLQIGQFIISIILARLLSPNDYGAVALLTIFIQIAFVFVQSGLGTALVQKKDADETDFSSVFYLSFIIASLCYTLIFFTAPSVARFYELDILKPALRVLALSLFFNAFTTVQYAIISKTMQFKRFFYSSLGGVFGSGLLGIVLAFKNFGVWALVAQQLSNTIFIFIILFITLDWKPRLLFSLRKVKALFSFGWKLLLSSLIDTGFNNIYGLIIGKRFSSETLGFYTRGQQFPQVIASNLDGSIQSVLLPTYSAKNDDVEAVKKIARQSISTSAFFLVPAMFGLAAIAKPLVTLILTEKWLPSVPFLQLACIFYSWRTLQTTNLTAINALGYSNIYLRLEIIKKTVSLIALCITVPLGIMAMAIGEVFTSFLCTIINASPNKKLMNYSYLEQIKDMLPSYILSILMFALVLLCSYLPFARSITLILQILVGALSYTLLSVLFNKKQTQFILATIKGFKSGK